MAAISIPYGRGTQTLSIDDARLAAVLTPNHAELTSAAQEEIVQNALENPIGSVRLCEKVKGKENILVITSDHTRPVPSRITMPLLLGEIRKGKISGGSSILPGVGVIVTE